MRVGYYKILISKKNILNLGKSLIKIKLKTVAKGGAILLQFKSYPQALFNNFHL